MKNKENKKVEATNNKPAVNGKEKSANMLPTCMVLMITTLLLTAGVAGLVVIGNTQLALYVAAALGAKALIDLIIVGSLIKKSNKLLANSDSAVADKVEDLNTRFNEVISSNSGLSDDLININTNVDTMKAALDVHKRVAADTHMNITELKEALEKNQKVNVNAFNKVINTNLDEFHSLRQSISGMVDAGVNKATGLLSEADVKYNALIEQHEEVLTQQKAILEELVELKASNGGLTVDQVNDIVVDSMQSILTDAFDSLKKDLLQVAIDFKSKQAENHEIQIVTTEILKELKEVQETQGNTLGKVMQLIVTQGNETSDKIANLVSSNLETTEDRMTGILEENFKAAIKEEAKTVQQVIDEGFTNVISKVAEVSAAVDNNTDSEILKAIELMKADVEESSAYTINDIGNKLENILHNVEAGQNDIKQSLSTELKKLNGETGVNIANTLMELKGGQQLITEAVNELYSSTITEANVLEESRVELLDINSELNSIGKNIQILADISGINADHLVETIAAIRDKADTTISVLKDNTQQIANLKELHEAMNTVNSSVASVGEKVDGVGDKVDTIGGKVENVVEKVADIGDKVDKVSEKVENTNNLDESLKSAVKESEVNVIKTVSDSNEKLVTVVKETGDKVASGVTESSSSLENTLGKIEENLTTQINESDKSVVGAINTTEANNATRFNEAQIRAEELRKALHERTESLRATISSETKAVNTLVEKTGNDLEEFITMGFSDVQEAIKQK